MRNKNVVKDSLADGKRIRKMAEAVAKKKIIENLTPSIRRLVENRIDVTKDEDVDRLRRAADGRGETEFEEGKAPEGDYDMGEEEIELEGMFPQLAEMEDEEAPAEEMDEYGFAFEGEEEEELPMESNEIPTLGEGDEGDMDDMDEEITIDEAGLKKAYESIMKANAALSEAQVTSGFADTYPKSEWETEDSPPSDTGLMDKEGGDKPWDEGRPGASEDFSVKESIERALREAPALRGYIGHLEEQLTAAHRVVGKLKEEVKSVNLFNMKVVRVNEMLNKFGKKLTNEQKKVVIGKIDSAKTVREVRIVTEALSASFTSSGLVKESRRRRPRANASRATSSGSPNQRVLRESVNKKAGNDQYARIRELAGLVR